MSSLPGDLGAEVRDALAHFYDYAYLVRHPLLQRLQPLLGCEGTLAVQKARRLLLETIEQLRPRADTPPTDPAWRPYNVLQHRYVLGQELDEAEAKLGLGRRQIQREQHRALDALAIALADKLQAPAHAQPAASANGDPLWQEIARVAAEQQVFDAAEQYERALAPARSLAAQQGVTLVEQRAAGSLLITGDPALFRQLLLGALSFVIRLGSGRAWTVRLERSDGDVVCTLAIAPGQTVVAEDLPEALQALAQAQGTSVRVGEIDGGWCLRLALPAAERERTVAIVEDNQDVVALFSRYLAGRGYKLVCVGDVSRALERIAEIMPDVIVLDVMMREIDGWEVLQRLKADPHLRAIPVAICSVLDEPQLATSLGAQAYLRKPVRPAQLLECLAGLLARGAV